MIAYAIVVLLVVLADVRLVKPPYAMKASTEMANAAPTLCEDARMLDWNGVRFFLTIHRAKTLAGAARVLKVEHTTVGRRLAAMEASLRAKLFVRTPEGFRLTRMGEEILPVAEQAETSLLQIERIALADDDRAEGTVRVTTSESFAGLLARWI